jgi:hypothetical protein
LFRPEFVDQARKLCQLGATDVEVARFFNVSRMTIYRWQVEHPEFCDSMKIGKSVADDRVERSLYQRAIGYYVNVKKKVTKTEDGTVTETTEHIPRRCHGSDPLAHQSQAKAVAREGRCQPRCPAGT